jgi:hypothetical protein
MTHPLAHRAVQMQAPLGSLAHIDPLEQTGIVVEAGDPLLAYHAQGHHGMPGAGESGPVPMGPGFLPAGASQAMARGRAPGGTLGRWAALAQRPWLLLVIILLVGVGTAAVIGLSGPTVEAGSGLRPLGPSPAAAMTAP